MAYFDKIQNPQQHWQQAPPVSILSDGNSINLHEWKPALIYAVFSQWKTLIIFFVIFVLNSLFNAVFHSDALAIGHWSWVKILVVFFIIIPAIIGFMKGISKNPVMRKYLGWFVFAFIIYIFMNFFIFGKSSASQSIRKSIWDLIIGFFLVAVLYRIVYIRNIMYRLTNEQIVSTSGILSKTSHYIELYRVKDIIIKQNFFERIFGLMNISIISIDAATPVFTMQGLPYLPDLQLQMRNLAQQCRMRYNVYSIN